MRRRSRVMSMVMQLRWWWWRIDALRLWYNMMNFLVSINSSRNSTLKRKNNNFKNSILLKRQSMSDIKFSNSALIENERKSRQHCLRI